VTTSLAGSPRDRDRVLDRLVHRVDVARQVQSAGHEGQQLHPQRHRDARQLERQPALLDDVHPGQHGQQRRVGRRAQQIRGHQADRVLVERVQRQLDRVGRFQPGQGGPHRRVQFPGANGEQPQDGVRQQVTRQGAERDERGRVGPLHVVDDDEQRNPHGRALERFLHLP
jgi:hypothetical protein